LPLKRWITLVVVSIATAMLLLDVTIVYVALPSIGDDLGAGFPELQWVIDAYTVVMAASLLAAGALADRVGRRAVFTGGLAVFTFFSALCGVAGTPLVIDLSRAAQGLGAAAMFASSLAILAHEFRGRDRGIAFGVWGAVTGASLAFGPLLGGLLVDGPGWRWVFLVNIPLGLVLIATTLAMLPESRQPRPRPPDVAGMATFGAAVLLAAFALIRGNQDGWGSAVIVASIAGALVLSAGFVFVERRAASPMLPLGLFRIRAFSGTALLAFAQSVAIYPLLLFLAIYFQDALALSATGTGLKLLPLTLAIFVVAPAAGRLTAILPLRLPLVSGMLLLGASMLVMHGVDAESSQLLPGLLLGGIAIGLISPALAAAMVSVLPVEQSGLSSGINNTFRQLGIAIGIAGLGAIFDSRVAAAAGAPTGIADGVNSVLLVSAAVAILAGLASWPLLGGQRSTAADGPPAVGESPHE
jgi:EmrB/QacA subfamily drug resistance transporter